MVARLPVAKFHIQLSTPKFYFYCRRSGSSSPSVRQIAGLCIISPLFLSTHFIFQTSSDVLSSPVQSLELFEGLICWSRCYCSILYTNLLYCSDLEMLSRIFLESRVESYQAAQHIQHAILWSFNVMPSSKCVSSINRCAVHYLTACRSISFRSFFSLKKICLSYQCFLEVVATRIYIASFAFSISCRRFFSVFSSILFLRFSLPFFTDFPPF